MCLAGVLLDLVRTLILFAAWQEQLPRPERRTNFQKLSPATPPTRSAVLRILLRRVEAYEHTICMAL